MNKVAKYDLDWLKTQVDTEVSMKFIYFWGNTERNGEVTKACMSQWYDSPFTVDGILYNTTEHWMMAKKARLFGDSGILQKILECNKPGEAKALGREVKGYVEAIWLQERYAIVREGNMHKFEQHPALREFLVNTGNRILVEASPVDNIWGIGMAHDHKDIGNVHGWPGLNLLGFALMEVREKISQTSTILPVIPGC